MNVVTDDMVQAALDAYSENEWRTSASAMRAALAAVAPLIAAAERERCARLAEDRHLGWVFPHPDDARPGEVCDDATACADIAAAIRALP